MLLRTAWAYRLWTSGGIGSWEGKQREKTVNLREVGKWGNTVWEEVGCRPKAKREEECWISGSVDVGYVAGGGTSRNSPSVHACRSPGDFVAVSGKMTNSVTTRNLAQRFAY